MNHDKWDVTEPRTNWLGITVSMIAEAYKVKYILTFHILNYYQGCTQRTLRNGDIIALCGRYAGSDNCYRSWYLCAMTANAIHLHRFIIFSTSTGTAATGMWTSGSQTCGSQLNCPWLGQWICPSSSPRHWWLSHNLRWCWNGSSCLLLLLPVSCSLFLLLLLLLISYKTWETLHNDYIMIT